MTQVAQLAERNQHHPDWHNLYNQVDVTLTTDDQACLSTFDIELAQQMDLIYDKIKKAIFIISKEKKLNLLKNNLNMIASYDILNANIYK